MGRRRMSPYVQALRQIAFDMMVENVVPRHPGTHNGPSPGGP